MIEGFEMRHSPEYDAYLKGWRLVNPSLFNLLSCLRSYAVRWWTAEAPEHEQYEPGMDRVPEPLCYANVVSSELRREAHSPFGEMVAERRHVVAIDLDIPAYLVPSTTEGHSHLYIDVPGGIEHGAYMNLLGALARCGIIEQGYAEVSQKRGHTDLRPPWIKKEQVAVAAPPVQQPVADFEGINDTLAGDVF